MGNGKQMANVMLKIASLDKGRNVIQVDSAKCKVERYGKLDSARNINRIYLTGFAKSYLQKIVLKKQYETQYEFALQFCNEYYFTR